MRLVRSVLADGAGTPAAAKPVESGPKADVEAESDFVEWLEALKFEGADCAMLKEDTVQKGTK